MNPFRRRTREEDDGPTLVSISITQLKRQFVYDMGLADHVDIVEGAGLTRVSDEVDEMEQRASDARLSEITAISDIISRYAQISADCMLAVSFAEKDEDFDAEQYQATWEIFRTVSAAAIQSFLASFIDLGLIHGHYVTPNYSDE